MAEQSPEYADAAFAVKTRASELRERVLYIAAAVALVVLVLVPLTSTDQAQAAGLPLMVDRYWFRVATTMAVEDFFAR